MIFRIFSIVLAFFIPVCGAQALPRLVIYNYSPSTPILELTGMTPFNHQEYTASPPLVKLTFSQAIDPSRSSLIVFDPYSNTIATGNSTNKDNVIETTLPPHLLSGSYRIEWKGICSCAGSPALGGTSYFTVD